MATAVLGFLLICPIVKAVAQNNIANPTMQIVVGAMVSILIRSYAIQSLLVFSVGLIMLIYYYIKAKRQAPVSANRAI